MNSPQLLLEQLTQSQLEFSRLFALRQLGELPESDERIVAALIASAQADPSEKVRTAAQELLRLPIHQEIKQKKGHLVAEQTVGFVMQLPAKLAPVAEDQAKVTSSNVLVHLLWDLPMFLFEILINV